jgi:hypothetical protein
MEVDFGQSCRQIEFILYTHDARLHIPVLKTSEGRSAPVRKV